MVTLYTVDEFTGSWKNRLNFLRLNRDPREVVFCDGKGRIVPLSYDVQAAVLELFGNVKETIVLQDELRTLRGECQRLQGALDQVKKDQAASAWKLSCGTLYSINRALRKQFGMGE